MFQVIATYPLLSLVVVLGVLALLGVDILALVKAVRALIGYKEAGIINARAVEEAGEEAKSALGEAERDDPEGKSVGVQVAKAVFEKVLQIKTKSRLNSAFAARPIKDAMADTVAHVDKEKSPVRKILGIGGRILLGAFGIRL